MAAGPGNPAHRGDRGPDLPFLQQQIFGHRGNIPDAGIGCGPLAVRPGQALIHIIDPIDDEGRGEVSLQIFDGAIGEFDRQIEGG